MEGRTQAETAVEVGDEPTVPLPDLKTTTTRTLTERARGKKHPGQTPAWWNVTAAGLPPGPKARVMCPPISGHFLTLSEASTGSRLERTPRLITGTKARRQNRPLSTGRSVTSGHQKIQRLHAGLPQQFTATPWDVRSDRKLNHPKPKVLGSQTAVAHRS